MRRTLTRGELHAGGRAGLMMMSMLVLLMLAGCGGSGGNPVVTPEVTLPPEVITPAPETVVAIQTASARDLATAAANEVATAIVGADVDPCALLSQQEVEAIVGRTMIGPATSDPSMPLLCTLPFDEFDLHLFVASSGDLVAYGLNDSADSGYESRREQSINSEGFEELDGPGDAAFAGIGAITVLAGDYLLLLDSASVAQLTAIAELAVSRLPDQ